MFKEVKNVLRFWSVMTVFYLVLAGLIFGGFILPLVVDPQGGWSSAKVAGAVITGFLAALGVLIILPVGYAVLSSWKNDMSYTADHARKRGKEEGPGGDSV